MWQRLFSMEISRYTEKEYWDAKYLPKDKHPLEVTGFRNLKNKGLYNALLSAGLDNKRVLEIGAGDSQWLPFLSKKHPTSTFVGLDYSQLGCIELEARAEQEGANVEVVCADMFSPPEDMLGSFDLIYSIGVVEHFDNLPVTLQALSDFVKPGGKVLSEIPNLAGLNGFLVKMLNKPVYDLHNPHDLNSLKAGHLDAGLELDEFGYIASNDFGVLSACINEDSSKINKLIYTWLNRVTKLIGMFEERFVSLPKSRIFSPVMYCTAKVSVQ